MMLRVIRNYRRAHAGSIGSAPGRVPGDTVHPVRRCLGAIINEEWEHRTLAERDLDALEPG